ncbi:unnamed protein product, partial [marine sediment metagenome]
DTLVALGDEQDNVLKVLEAFGITAEWVAEKLGIEVDAIDRARDAWKGYGDAATQAGVAVQGSAGDIGTAAAAYSRGQQMGAAFLPHQMREQARVISGEITAEKFIAWRRAVGIELAKELGTTSPHERPSITVAEYIRALEDVIARLGPAGLQHEGIAMRPIVTRIAEKKPEAVLSIDRLERMVGGSGKTISVYVELDKRVIAKAVGQPLVDEIRLKTGIHI